MAYIVQNMTQKVEGTFLLFYRLRKNKIEINIAYEKT